MPKGCGCLNRIGLSLEVEGDGVAPVEEWRDHSASGLADEYGSGLCWLCSRAAVFTTSPVAAYLTLPPVPLAPRTARPDSMPILYGELGQAALVHQL